MGFEHGGSVFLEDDEMMKLEIGTKGLPLTSMAEITE
jgi:hypothetical protein